MKLTKDILKVLEPVIKKTHVSIEGMYVFFPIDLTVTTTDEFGIETTKYKTESYYGNSYVPGIIIQNGSDPYCRLAYAPTTSLVAFDLGGYMTVTYQSLSEEEKLAVCQYEACLVKEENCNCAIPALYLK